MPNIACISVEHQDCGILGLGLVRCSDEECRQGFAIWGGEIEFLVVCEAELGGTGDGGAGIGGEARGVDD